MRLTLVVLLALTLMPIAPIAHGKTVIEVYQEHIQKLINKDDELEQLITDAKQKVTEFEKEANSIKALIAKYETALETTTQEISVKHEAQLKTVKDAYKTELAAEAKLAEQARKSAEDDAKATRAILDELGTSAEKVAKLTDAVSVSGDGNVGIGTTSPSKLLDVYGDVRIGKTNARHYLEISSQTWPEIRWTTPTYSSDMRIGMAHGDSSGYAVSNGDWYVYSPATNRMDIIMHRKGGVSLAAKGGNVGIGTTSPQYKLHVAGKIKGELVSPSDQRHKKNIHSLENTLSKLAQLRGVSFKWKDNAQNADTQIGLIAQEVETVLPELVSTDNEGYKSIAYGKLTAVLIEALKEQQLQIKRLENLIHK
ncbi:tail fiber domain-containing protein [Candidatus Parabeggiatoa sp. HSG14]|uniref:tail fiber domain-containing protein n=1 Tax=Candidatus Parabeggiatoa sp. HSG14 TaxID=3055593 RepID=UPI0025A89B2C|nr:tail fiber domain-containing protein [Thiotrichales bacterium HSG14]